MRAIVGQAALDGHWLTPTLYGEPFLTKPPGSYVAIALASIPRGHVTEESARLPSAVAATFTVLFAFSTLRRGFDDSRAFIAAMLLPVSFLWLDKAPSAEIDMLQLAWVAAALLSFLRAIEEPGRSMHALTWSLAAMLCVAGGFLTKWTAPAFFYLTVIPFLWLSGRLRWLSSREHLLGAIAAIAICAVWATLAAREVGWGTLRDTVLQEASQRFGTGSKGKGYPWSESLLFPFAFLGANLPWSVPAVFALRPKFLASLGESERRLLQLLHCWAWPNLLFWSLPSQHHVRYVLPICPAISFLGSFVICRWSEVSQFGRRKLHCWKFILLGVVVVWASTKVVFVESIVPARTAERHARRTGESLAALVPPGEILYLCRLKDEGVLFYYARPARHLDDLESPTEARYLLLFDQEWTTGPFSERFEEVAALQDQQSAVIHLVRRRQTTKDDYEWLRDRPTHPKSSRSPP